VAESPQTAADVKRERYPAGAINFNQGDAAEVMYIVQDGIVECLRGDQVINTIGPGGILGEMAIVNHQPRSLTARAKHDCDLRVLDEQAFIFSVQHNPYFALEVIRTLAARLRHQTST
jgi:CRP-like cAMP-binding protein